MRQLWLVLASAAMSSLSGCASPPPVQVPRNVDLTHQCFDSYEAIPAIDLGYLSDEAAKELRPQQFADLAHCFSDTSGERFPVAVYRLEAFTVPSTVKVVLTASPYGVLAAAVSIRDGDFRELSNKRFDSFVNRGQTFTADVFINDVQARYVVLSPDHDRVGEEETRLSSDSKVSIIPAGPFFFFYRSSQEVANELSFSDAGSVLVTLVNH